MPNFENFPSQFENNNENSNESKELTEEGLRGVSLEEWKAALPEALSGAEYSFLNFNPDFYLDNNDNYYVVYNEDGEKRARKLYEDKGQLVSEEINPNDIEG